MIIDDFKIIINDKEYSCTKYDKVCIEFDNSATRSNIDCTELKHLIESCNVPRESITCTIHIKKKNPNYKRMCKFFKKLLREHSVNEN